MASKQLLLPKGEFQVDQATQRIYVTTLKLAQAVDLVADNQTNENRMANVLEREVISSNYPL